MKKLPLLLVLLIFITSCDVPTNSKPTEVKQTTKAKTEIVLPTAEECPDMLSFYNIFDKYQTQLKFEKNQIKIADLKKSFNKDIKNYSDKNKMRTNWKCIISDIDMASDKTVKCKLTTLTERPINIIAFFPIDDIKNANTRNKMSNIKNGDVISVNAVLWPDAETYTQYIQYYDNIDQSDYPDFNNNKAYIQVVANFSEFVKK